MTSRSHSCLLLALGLLCSAARAQSTQRTNLASDGREGNLDAYGGYFSADGRFVAFASDASNIVSGDTNATADAFVHDHFTGLTEITSISPAGAVGNGQSGVNGLAISGDGRFVAFASDASNLVPGDTNGVQDVFVRDRLLATTVRVSVSSAGQQGNRMSGHGVMISGDGRYVAFGSDADNLSAGDLNGRADVFVHDLQTGTTARESLSASGFLANDSSFPAGISSDGRFVIFTSFATNLVPSDLNQAEDAFVRDRLAATTQRVSVDSWGVGGNGGSWAGGISDDGRLSVFSSGATNLVAGDTNGFDDVFLHDASSGGTLRVSVHPSGAQADDESYEPRISAGGAFVTFTSAATNLVAVDQNDSEDVFLYELAGGALGRISVSSSGAEADEASEAHQISPDGRFIAYESLASNLVHGDTNGMVDIFLYDRLCAGTVARYGSACAGSGGSAPELLVGGCPSPGQHLRVSIARALGGSPALLLIGSARLALPLGAGCELLVGSLLSDPLPLTLGGAGAGRGFIHLPVTVPPGSAGATLHLQAITLDAGAPLGFTASAGARVSLR